MSTFQQFVESLIDQSSDESNANREVHDNPTTLDLFSNLIIQ